MKFLVIYPYRFNDFLWNLLELDEISEFAEVMVWDVSMISSPRFSSGLRGQFSVKKEVSSLASLVALNRKLRELLHENIHQEVCILNEIGQNSFQNFLINFVISRNIHKKDVKVFDLFNGGVPIHYASQITDIKRKNYYSKLASTVKVSSNPKEFQQKLSAFFFGKLSRCFNKPLTHRLVAGRVWEKEASQNVSLGVQIVKGHSHDYSLFLRAAKSLREQTSEGTAIFLDGAGPFYNSDSLLTGRNTFFSSDVWYPALSKFFNFLEDEQKLRITVAGHYKTNFDSPSGLFGDREVIYGQTPTLVESAQFVLTRMSTAVSFAVLYKKPILFIYSDQLLKDSEFMDQAHGLSRLLGTFPLNIDHFPTNIDHYLEINEERYEKYIHDVLTSKPLGEPNYKIILKDIMGTEIDR